jgi:hypothetical protein
MLIAPGAVREIDPLNVIASPATVVVPPEGAGRLGDPHGDRRRPIAVQVRGSGSRRGRGAGCCHHELEVEVLRKGANSPVALEAEREREARAHLGPRYHQPKQCGTGAVPCAQLDRFRHRPMVGAVSRERQLARAAGTATAIENRRRADRPRGTCASVASRLLRLIIGSLGPPLLRCLLDTNTRTCMRARDTCARAISRSGGPRSVWAPRVVEGVGAQSPDRSGRATSP